MSKSIRVTYRNGKELTNAAALKAAGNLQSRKEEIANDARGMVCSWFREQWKLLLLGAPFMFAGSVIEMVAPGYVGLIIDGIRIEDFDYVYNLIVQFLYITLGTAFCALLREIIFGITSQKIGLSIRRQLFANLVKKDVTFFDKTRTGSMLSRLNSDTQVVQDGLTTNVSMAVKSTCIVLVVTGILFTYNIKLTFIIIALIIP